MLIFSFAIMGFFMFVLLSSMLVHLTVSTSYEICRHRSFECAGLNMSYPFGILNGGCGLLGFQVECDRNPKLHVRRNNYVILNTSFIVERRITIVNEKFLLPCGLDPDAYEDLQGTEFGVSRLNSNVTLAAECGSKLPKGFSRLDCNGTKNSRWAWKLSDDGNTEGISCTNSYPFPLVDKPKNVSKNSSEFLQILQKGFQVEWAEIKTISNECGSCESTQGICGYSPYSEDFCCYCPDGKTNPHNCAGGSENSTSHNKKSLAAVAAGGVIGTFGLVVVAVLLVNLYTRRNAPNSMRGRTRDLETSPKIGTLPIFSHHELEEATNYFADVNHLGNGGFGSVYLGRLPDGRMVAVKRLYQDNTHRVEHFINEVEILSSLHHPNLVRLFGCTCLNSRELLLVYEYIPNGTLADHLHGNRRAPGGLEWSTRLGIAVETARALAFLHSFEPPIFHRDVKSANILLDTDFRAKVSDFGLSRLGPLNVSHVTTAPHGTPGYLDPEYQQSFQLTDKSDVYSFGVVLVEIISAKLAVDVKRNRREIGLANMAVAKIQGGVLDELVDTDLGIESDKDVKSMVWAVAELAYECLATEGDDRPNMKEVVYRLEQIREMGKVNN